MTTYVKLPGGRVPLSAVVIIVLAALGFIGLISYSSSDNMIAPGVADGQAGSQVQSDDQSTQGSLPKQPVPTHSLNSPTQSLRRPSRGVWDVPPPLADDAVTHPFEYACELAAKVSDSALKNPMSLRKLVGTHIVRIPPNMSTSEMYMSPHFKCLGDLWSRVMLKLDKCSMGNCAVAFFLSLTHERFLLHFGVANRKQGAYVLKESVPESLADHYSQTEFARIAKEAGTDKVTGHQYQVLYGRHISDPAAEVKSVFEIGAGCTMVYGPGASYVVWTTMPNIEWVHFLEYNRKCYDAAKARGEGWVNQCTVGDQSNFHDMNRLSHDIMTSLQTWKGDGVKDFTLDAIIDDGGHQNYQIKNSLMGLGSQLPWSLYFVEDFGESHASDYYDATDAHSKRYSGTAYDYFAHSPWWLANGEISGVECLPNHCVMASGLH